MQSPCQNLKCRIRSKKRQGFHVDRNKIEHMWHLATIENARTSADSASNPIRARFIFETRYWERVSQRM